MKRRVGIYADFISTGWKRSLRPRFADLHGRIFNYSILRVYLSDGDPPIEALGYPSPHGISGHAMLFVLHAVAEGYEPVAGSPTCARLGVVLEGRICQLLGLLGCDCCQGTQKS